MPQIALGSTLDLSAATRTLTAKQLLTLAWRRGNLPYAGGAFPWGDPPLSSLTEWLAGYLDTQASYVPGAPQTNYPALASLTDEAEVYANGDAIATGVGNVFSIVNGALVIQPRSLLPAEVAAVAATPALTGRTIMSGAFCSAPFCQAGGYFEVEAKLPPLIAGVWPAPIWLLPMSGAWPPEIDGLEALFINGAPTLTTSIHTTDAAWGAAGNQQTVTIPVTFDPTAGLHQYGVLVEADFITTFFDRIAVRSVPTPTDLVNTPLYMICDYAIGGVGSWPGPMAPGTTPGALTISDVSAYTGTITAGVAAPPAPVANPQTLALQQIGSIVAAALAA
jgi:Glycosyl hydrolases family 16